MDNLNDISVAADFTIDKFTEIKVDLKTPLENAFWWLIVLSAAAIGIAIVLNSGPKFDLQWQGVIVVAGACLVLSASLYFNTDNFYIFNLVNKKIFYHCKIFFYKRVECIASFEDIHAVTTTGRRHGNRSDDYYTYRVQCVLNTGQIICLSDETREDFEMQKRIARKISAITGAEYVDGLPGCHAVVKKAGEKFSFNLFECSWLDLTKTSLLEVLAGIVYIAVLITIGKIGPEIIQILKSIFG